MTDNHKYINNKRENKKKTERKIKHLYFFCRPTKACGLYDKMKIIYVQIELTAIPHQTKRI